MVSFAGEHCHPSFFSTAHGAFLTGRSAAQFFLNVAAPRFAQEEDEDVYNLGAASVDDLSSWLHEVSMGEKKLEDYKHKRNMKNYKRPSRRIAGGGLVDPQSSESTDNTTSKH